MKGDAAYGNTTSENRFVFVSSSGPCMPEDAVTRGNIRRQAMSRIKSSRQQTAEAQKRKPGAQYIIIRARPKGMQEFEFQDLTCNATEEIGSILIQDDFARQSYEPRDIFLKTIRPNPTSSGYEVLRSKYQFDILDLAGFTTINIDRDEAGPLLGKPSQILTRFRKRQWSFFSYIPARFGNSQCCDDAVRCIAAACHSIIMNDNLRSSKVLSLYSQSLQSLQKALYDPNERLKPDTLCAVDILAIYELLNLADEDDVQWRRHIVGAASIIEARGPESFNSEFEKSLLLAQTGPIFLEAIIDDPLHFFGGDAARLRAGITRRLQDLLEDGYRM